MPTNESNPPRPGQTSTLDLKSFRRWLPLLVVAGTAVVLMERLYLLVSRYAVNIFFSDQWEFNSATVFQQHTLWEIFNWQHGPHRQGLGGVLAKLIEPHFQWDSRIESFLIAGIFALAALLAVWLKERLFGRLEYYDVLIPSLFLTSTQCEAILGAANLAHGSLPLLLIVVYCLAWTIEMPSARFAVVLCINLLLIFTGFGLLMGVITPLAILLNMWIAPAAKRAVEIHVSALAASLVSLGLFFIHYVWNPAVDCYDSVLVSRSPADYFQFAALMCANYVGLDGLSTRHPAAWGSLILLLLLATLALVLVTMTRFRKSPAESNNLLIVTFALLAFSLTFCAATARGRLCLGLGAAQESRYMPYLTPGFLGAYFYLSRTLLHRWIRHAVLSAFLLLCAFASWPIHVGDQLEISGFHSSKLRWKTCYLTNHNVALCSRETRVKITNPAEQIHLQEKLDLLEKEHLNLFDGR